MATFSQAGARPVLPDLTILLGVFDRQGPNPAAVGEFTRLVHGRKLFLVGWIRQGLLTRTRDERQFHRLLTALAPFPDIPIVSTDHIEAARLVRELRAREQQVQPAQALLWTVADRIGAEIWSNDRSWRALAEAGAPLHRLG